MASLQTLQSRCTHSKNLHAFPKLQYFATTRTERAVDPSTVLRPHLNISMVISGPFPSWHLRATSLHSRQCVVWSGGDSTMGTSCPEATGRPRDAQECALSRISLFVHPKTFRASENMMSGLVSHLSEVLLHCNHLDLVPLGGCIAANAGHCDCIPALQAATPEHAISEQWEGSPQPSSRRWCNQCIHAAGGNLSGTGPQFRIRIAEARLGAKCCRPC